MATMVKGSVTTTGQQHLTWRSGGTKRILELIPKNRVQRFRINLSDGVYLIHTRILIRSSIQGNLQPNFRMGEISNKEALYVL